MVCEDFKCHIRVYSRKKGHTCGITKIGQESPVKGHNFGFYSLFCKFRTFRMLHPPKRHVFLEVLVEKKTFRFSKRALPVGTACNKWLK